MCMHSCKGERSKSREAQASSEGHEVCQREPQKVFSTETRVALHSRKSVMVTHLGGKILHERFDTLLHFLQMTLAKNTYEELDAALCCSTQKRSPFKLISFLTKSC